MKTNKLRKGLVFVMAGMLTLAMSAATVFAAPPPPNDPDPIAPTIGTATTNQATLAVGKTVHSVGGKLQHGNFSFEIEAVEAMNGTTGLPILVANMPMPAQDTVTVNISASDVANKTVYTEGTSFAAMTFLEPGYYLYKVNEVIPAVPVDGITYDETSYFVCIYVVENIDANTSETQTGIYVKSITSWHNDKGSSTYAPNLSDIAAVADNNGQAAQTIQPDGITATFGKVNYTKFINQRAAVDIAVEKVVTGNLGNRDYDFEFATDFEGLNPGTTYTYTITEAGEPQPHGEPAAPAEFIADNNGEYSVQYTLKGGDSIQFHGIPVGATYQTTESASNHIASYEITSDVGTVVIANATDANNAHTAALATDVETADSVDGLVTTTFTNDRNLATITGVPGMDYMAYGLIALILAGAGYAIFRRRSCMDEE